MKAALLFPLSFCIAVSTAAIPDAQGSGVKDGSHWSGGGTEIAMDVGFTSTEGVVTVQAISASGWSNTTSGTTGDNHSDECASADTSGIMTVPTEEGSMQVRAVDGHMERNDNGTWRRMTRKLRVPVPSSIHDSQTLEQGHQAPWSGLLLSPDGRTYSITVGEEAPWTGLLCPSEEVVSLPLN